MANFSTKPTCLSLDIQPSPRASFLLSLSALPSSPCTPFIKVHLLCFLLAPSLLFLSSLIGEFVPMPDWTLFSVPPLMTPPLTFRTRPKCHLILQQPLLLLEGRGEKKVLERHLEDRMLNKDNSFFVVFNLLFILFYFISVIS